MAKLRLQKNKNYRKDDSLVNNCLPKKVELVICSGFGEGDQFTQTDGRRDCIAWFLNAMIF